MRPGATCSDRSADVREQLVGSAPHARAWLALEQPGPWGPKAFTQSHLHPELGRAVESAAVAHDVRPALIRRPGRHPDDPGPGGGRRLLVAFTEPGRSWLLDGLLPGPEPVTHLDWAALRDGDLDAVRRSLPLLAPARRPQLLVCTNGRRDVCCAVKGRPLALAVAAAEPRRVWEVTHTSGHRFAPTAVLLPAGTLHGRLDPAAAGELLRAADRGRTVVVGSRGRTTWTAPGQVAELAVREAVGETGLDALTVTQVVKRTAHRWTVEVRHTDGRRWGLDVASNESGVHRVESCGKDAVSLRRWTWTLEAAPAPLR